MSRKLIIISLELIFILLLIIASIQIQKEPVRISPYYLNLSGDKTHEGVEKYCFNVTNPLSHCFDSRISGEWVKFIAKTGRNLT